MFRAMKRVLYLKVNTMDIIDLTCDENIRDVIDLTEETDPEYDSDSGDTSMEMAETPEPEEEAEILEELRKEVGLDGGDGVEVIWVESEGETDKIVGAQEVCWMCGGLEKKGICEGKCWELECQYDFSEDALEKAGTL